MLRAVLGAGVQLAKPRRARCCVDRRGEDFVSVVDFAKGGSPGAMAHNYSEGAEVVAERDACAHVCGEQVIGLLVPVPAFAGLGVTSCYRIVVMGQSAGGGGGHLIRVLRAHPRFRPILDSLRSNLLQVHEDALLEYKNELATALDSVERAAGVPTNSQ